MTKVFATQAKPKCSATVEEAKNETVVVHKPRSKQRSQQTHLRLAIILETILLSWRDFPYLLRLMIVDSFAGPFCLFILLSISILVTIWPADRDRDLNTVRSYEFIPYITKLIVELVATVIFSIFLLYSCASGSTPQMLLRSLAWFNRLSLRSAESPAGKDVSITITWLLALLLLGFVYQVRMLKLTINLWKYCSSLPRGGKPGEEDVTEEGEVFRLAISMPAV